jgi:hypothetical protein
MRGKRRAIFVTAMTLLASGMWALAAPCIGVAITCSFFKALAALQLLMASSV